MKNRVNLFELIRTQAHDYMSITIRRDHTFGRKYYHFDLMTRASRLRVLRFANSHKPTGVNVTTNSLVVYYEFK